MQRDNYEGRVIASDLKNPDFVKLGESFGIRSTSGVEPSRAAHPDARAASKRDEPALIEVPVGEFPDPWRLFFRKKIRGQ